MIDLDTKNPAYSFRHEVVALIPPPPNYIRLTEIAELLGQCGTYYVRAAVEELQWAYPGLSIRRRKGIGDTLQCTVKAWPTIKCCGLDYLSRLEVGRKVVTV